MKKMSRKNKILFSAIVSFCVALSLVFPSFASVGTPILISSLPSSSYTDNQGNTIYSYNLMSVNYARYFLYKARSSEGAILYSRYNIWDNNAQAFLTWNANSGNDSSLNGVEPPQFNFDGLLKGNTITLTYNFQVTNIGNFYGGIGYCYLMLYDTAPSYADCVSVSYDSDTGYLTGDINYSHVVDSKLISIAQPQSPNEAQDLTVSFDFAIDTFNSNLFPVVFWSLAQVASFNLTATSIEVSRTYPTSGIIVENTQTIIDEIGETNESIDTIIGDMTIIKASLDTVKSTLSTISSRINTTNTRLNTLHNDMTNLHNDLFNGETVEFNTSETMAPEDIEDAHENIDYSKSAFQDFFGEWFTNTDLLPWFAQMWSTLLDDSGVGTPFFLLFPSALLLLVRSLFGR